MGEIAVAAVVAAAKRVRGRVKLQKIIYLLQQTGYDFGYTDFSLFLFGPFSNSLALDIDSASQGILHESQQETGLSFKATGEPVMRYDYKPGSQAIAEALLGILRDRLGGESDELVRRIEEMNRHSSPVLEVVATAVYLRTEQGFVHPGLWESVRDLKPHLKQYVARARTLLEQWDERELFQT